MTQMDNFSEAITSNVSWILQEIIIGFKLKFS